MFAVLSSARKTALRACMILSTLALAACDPAMMPGASGGGSGPRVDSSQPVPVALLLPRSDQGAGAVARSLENAARLAIADLDGVEIDLRVYDTGGNPQQAASQAQAAVDGGARIILGPLFAEAANAAGVAVSDEGVNILAFSNNTSIAGGNVFVLGQTFRTTANRLMGYAAGQGRNRVLIVHPENVEGQFGRNAIQAAAAANGVTVAGVESFAFSEQGVVSAVPRIRSTASVASADSVFLTSTAAGALPLLLQLMPETGISPASTQYIGLARWDVPPQTMSLPGAEGGWFAIPDPARSAAFASRYQAAYGASPHPLAGLAYDGIAAVGSLAASGRADAFGRGALTQGAGFEGTGGIFRLRADGTNERGLAVATIRNRQVAVIDPAPRSFGGAGF